MNELNINDYEIFKPNIYKPYINNDVEYLLNYKPYLDIVLTDFCNHDCKFCIADLIHRKLKIDIEKLKEKVDYAISELGVKEVLLLGGEPTVSNILFEVIDYLSEKKLDKIIMTTNGIRMAKDDMFLDKICDTALTNINISMMNLTDGITFADLIKISRRLRPKIKIRINVNIWRNNYDTVKTMVDFYNQLSPFIDSIKFSPLLRVDKFSVVNEKIEWVSSNILSDEEYDELFDEFQKEYPIGIITNNEQFGFVKNTMIPLRVPIILNWNQHGKMMQKVVEEQKINNIKLLPNGELSLSWNRELTEYFINTEHCNDKANETIRVRVKTAG